MTFLETIQANWAIILFIGGIFASWIRYEIKIINLTKEVEKIQTRNEVKDRESDGFREDMKVTMQEVKTTLKYIQDTLARLERK